MSLATHPFVRSAPGSIDTRNLLSVCRVGEALNQALLREMLGYFINENRQRVAMVAAAVEAGERETLRQTAHAIRGSAAMIGAGRLHDLAWGLEIDGVESEMPVLEYAVSRLRVEFDAVVAALHHAHPDALTD